MLPKSPLESCSEIYPKVASVIGFQGLFMIHSKDATVRYTKIKENTKCDIEICLQRTYVHMYYSQNESFSVLSKQAAITYVLLLQQVHWPPLLLKLCINAIDKISFTSSDIIWRLLVLDLYPIYCYKELMASIHFQKPNTEDLLPFMNFVAPPL